jgi:hypothetical protein
MIDSKLQNVILSEMIDKLDLPDYIYEKAVNRYKSLGEWFDRDDSSVINNKPTFLLKDHSLWEQQ